MPLLWRPDQHRGTPLLIIYVKDAPSSTRWQPSEARNANANYPRVEGRYARYLTAYPRDTEDQEVPENG